jgi:hypothetical protein
VARLLTAKVKAAVTHAGHDTAVPDGRALKLKAARIHEPLKAQVGHDGRNDAAALEPIFSRPSARNNRHDLIAIDDIAMLITDHQPVRIAVERNADVGR